MYVHILFVKSLPSQNCLLTFILSFVRISLILNLKIKTFEKLKSDQFYLLKYNLLWCRNIKTNSNLSQQKSLVNSYTLTKSKPK